MSEIVMDCVNPQGCPNPENHLYYNPQKELFYCFRCGWSADHPGDTEKLFEAYEQVHGEPLDTSNLKSLERSWRDISLDDLKEGGKSGSSHTSVQGAVQDDDVLPDDYAPIQDGGSYLEDKAIEYLEEERGISPGRARYYRIGYGCSETLGRLIIPVFNKNGRAVYWIERKYLFGKRRYNNPPNQKVEQGKSEIVYGLNTVPHGSQIYITEGVFDAISLGPQAVSILGKEMSGKQQSKIIRKEPRKVVVVLDAEAKYESVSIGRELEAFTVVEWVMLDEGDPDDLNEIEKMDYLDSSDSLSFTDEIELQLASS